MLRPTLEPCSLKIDLTSYTWQVIKILGSVEVSVICWIIRVIKFTVLIVDESDNLMKIHLYNALKFTIQQSVGTIKHSHKL